MRTPSLFVAVLALTTSLVEAQSPQYVALDIGSLLGKGTLATALNEKGDVVGSSFVTGYIPHVGARSHAVLYRNGALIDLFPDDVEESSVATAINEAGQVVGYRLWDAMGPGQPFVWQEGEEATILNPFDVMPLFAATGAANAINDSGEIAGGAAKPVFTEGATTTTLVGRAFRLTAPWVDVAATDLTPDLDPLYSSSTAVALNDSGHVVWTQGKPGHWPDTWDTSDSFFSDGLSVTALDALFPPKSSFEPQAMSDTGQVVGYVFGAAPPVQAYAYANGSMTHLAPLAPGTPARAYGVNAAGDVVGTATDANGDWRAVLWKDDAVFDLNDAISPTLGVVLTEARAINDHGQIVAWGHLASSPELVRSFRLTPRVASDDISDLVDWVIGLDLPHGIENSLTQKLQNALAALDAGDTQGVCDLLNAFIHEVAAQAGKKIEASAAAQAIDAANDVRVLLGCS